MIRYILRRSAYSVLIIIGVLIVTFLLFRVAAGDPAATVLGKNPSPREIEDMRLELGTDKPLFWGEWRKTDIYSGADFALGSELTHGEIEGDFEYLDDQLSLSKGSVRFKRNFDPPKTELKVELLYQGSLRSEYGDDDSPTWKTFTLNIPKSTEFFEIKTGEGGLNLRNVVFYRRHGSPWDSQLLASLGEIISFKSDAPYFTFFNFGRTLITREPISKILWRGIWPSLSIMLPIFLGELVLAIALSLVAAANRDSYLDKGVVIASVAGMSVSYLVFIIFGQWYLGYYFNLFPVWGWGSWRHLLLPIIIGIVSGLGGGVRFYRTVFVNELDREYLRTARAKGCGPFRIYAVHLLRNAAIPIITRATTIIPFLFTGSLLLESFFGIPGLGYAGVNALMNSDLQLVKALVILGAFIFVFVNLVADIAYAWSDPRIRLR